MTPDPSRAIFTITDDNYYIGIWFVQYPGGDWQATAWRPAPLREGQPVRWTLRWRFREYVDKKAFDSEDQKTTGGVSLEMPAHSDPDAFEETVRTVGGHAAEGVMLLKHGTRQDFIPVRGNGHTFMRVMRMEHPPWMHMKWEPLDPDGKRRKYDRWRMERQHGRSNHGKHKTDRAHAPGDLLRGRVRRRDQGLDPPRSE